MTAPRLVAAAFVLSVVASVAIMGLYLFGGQPQLEGVLLALALGGIGVGIVVWAIRLLDAPIETEERHPFVEPEPAPETHMAQTHPDQPLSSTEPITRRGFLLKLLIGAAGTLAAALAIPAFSLGPAPGQSLFQTAWRAGSRLVGEDGQPVRPDDLTLGSVRTVFPEGSVGSADSATLLVRVRPSDLQLADGRSAWAPEGCIGYSKICTHAGCPVGLYRAEDNALLCPCHQSTFDVLRGAVPTFGPAARPLPQLPLEVDADGYLVAQGDFPEPIGPSFWNLTHDNEDA